MVSDQLETRVTAGKPLPSWWKWACGGHVLSVLTSQAVRPGLQGGARRTAEAGVAVARHPS